MRGMPAQGSSSAVPQAVRLGYTRGQARAADSEAWEAFTRRFTVVPADDGAAAASHDPTTSRIAEDMIPWPCAGDEDPLALSISLGSAEVDEGATARELKLLVRALLRRWHPDKFLPRWQARFHPVASAERILARVKRITQALNQVLTQGASN